MSSLKLVFVFGVLAVSLTNVRAVSFKDKEKIHAAIIPHIAVCKAEFDVTEDDMKTAEASSALSITDSCLVGCILKKMKLINDQGLFDVDKAEELSKKFLSEEADQKKAIEIITTCKEVNEYQVTDVHGCERAGYLFECFMPFKDFFIN